MLFRQKFGRRHQRRLAPTTDGASGSGGRNDGFSATNVSLNESNHGSFTREIRVDVVERSSLSCSQRIGERGDELWLKTGDIIETPRGVGSGGLS